MGGQGLHCVLPERFYSEVYRSAALRQLEADGKVYFYDVRTRGGNIQSPGAFGFSQRLVLVLFCVKTALYKFNVLLLLLLELLLG